MALGCQKTVPMVSTPTHRGRLHEAQGGLQDGHKGWGEVSRIAYVEEDVEKEVAQLRPHYQPVDTPDKSNVGLPRGGEGILGYRGELQERSRGL